mmetsp:Transcript_21937/g.67580  ORF Transcript_21937/g.67580 Transcript_21937/m.67580 type:complete len:212 (+) Transcript_21937:693-1328(+)
MDGLSTATLNGLTRASAVATQTKTMASIAPSPTTTGASLSCGSQANPGRVPRATMSNSAAAAISLAHVKASASSRSTNSCSKNAKPEKMSCTNATTDHRSHGDGGAALAGSPLSPSDAALGGSTSSSSSSTSRVVSHAASSSSSSCNDARDDARSMVPRSRRKNALLAQGLDFTILPIVFARCRWCRGTPRGRLTRPDARLCSKAARSKSS